MDVHLTRSMKLLLVIFTAGVSVILLFHTTHLSLGLILLTLLYMATLFIRDYVLKLDLNRPAGAVCLVAQMLLAMTISVLSESFVAQAYILILIGEFSFYRRRSHAIVFTAASYLCIVTAVMIYRDMPLFQDVYMLFPRIIDFLAVFGMSLFARVVYRQQNKLAADNEQLRLASIELERKAKLEERARIAREIHDSVGHTLTSAITGLQTAAKAIEKGKHTLALEMVNRTGDSIRGGLDGVRTSVHLLREGISGEAGSFVSELGRLLNETREQTGADIAADIDPALPDLPPMAELTIYRALQEGLTNGIRHGGSRSFSFALTAEDGRLRFSLSNRGSAPAQIVAGFGLQAMRERVEGLGGVLDIASAPSRGEIALRIEVPLGETRRKLPEA